jgi:hypothetical protein
MLLVLSAAEAKCYAEEPLPLLAIWREGDGMRSSSKAPYLRIAIWENGRVLFARNTSKWSHELLVATIEPAQITELKNEIEKTGVFKLEGTCYLVPDAPEDCLMINLGERQQILRWDEVETPGYGINSYNPPKPQHVNFKKCWKAVNQLALKLIPKESKPYEKAFERPRSWVSKPAIQSK